MATVGCMATRKGKDEGANSGGYRRVTITLEIEGEHADFLRAASARAHLSLEGWLLRVATTAATISNAAAQHDLTPREYTRRAATRAAETHDAQRNPSGTRHKQRNT